MLLAVAIGLAVAGVAYASIPDSSGVIHGCYQKNNGQLRVIDTDKGQTCNASENQLTWAGQPPAVRATNLTGQSIPNATATNLTFPTETFDTTGTMHSTSSNTDQLVAPLSGTYEIVGSVIWAPNSTGTRGLDITVGTDYNTGTQIGETYGPASASPDFTDQTVSMIWRLNQGDVVTLDAYQGSGSALNAAFARFAMVWLGS